MSKKIKSFSLAEMLIAFLLTTILIAATMPLITKNKSRDEDSNSIACIKNDLIKNAGLDVSMTACTSNPDSPCCKSIVGCRYKMTNACTTLAYYADYGKTEEKNNARKVLREVCDEGGEKACDYFAMSCKRDSNVCDIPDSENDLAYYLNLAPNNPNPGKIIMENLVSKYYSLGYDYIKGKVDTIAGSCSSCIAKDIVNGGSTPAEPVETAWEKKFGGTGYDYGRGITLESGYVYLTGYERSDSNGGFYNDIFTIKMDTNGNVVWKKKIGGTVSDQGNGIAVETGNVYLTGYQNSEYYGVNEIFALKMDTNGNVAWKKKIGGASDDLGYGVAVESGNVYLTGYVYSNSAGNSDIYAIKLDANGNIIWKKKFGGTGSEFGNGIVVESGNSYIVGAEKTDSAGDHDAFAMKLDTNGNVVWKKKFGGVDDDRGQGIAVESGNVYITGYDYSFSTFKDFIYALKLDVNGNVIWKKKYGGTSGDSGRKIAVESGNIYLTGNAQSDGAGNTDLFALKLDTNGNIIWKKRFGGTGQDDSYGLAVKSGYIYLIGEEYTDVAGGGDICVIKLLPDQVSNLNISFTSSDLGSTYNGADLSSAFSGSDLTIGIGDLTSAFSNADLNSLFDGALINRTKFSGFD